MNQSKNSICKNCAHYFSFSQGDKQFLKVAFSQSYVDVSEVKGVCIREQISNGKFIDRILFSRFPMKHCVFKEIGNKIFKSPYHCPDCSNYLYIKNSGGYKIFYCDNCQKTFETLLINTNCRTCNKPLHIKSGVVFNCYCDKCRKAIDIPVLPQVYPSIIPKNEFCNHGREIKDCGVCFTCLNNRSNILFHEIPAAIKNQREKSQEKREKYENYLKDQNSRHSIGNEHFSVEDEGFFFEEDDLGLGSNHIPLNFKILDWSDDFDDIENWSDRYDYNDDFYLD